MGNSNERVINLPDGPDVRVSQNRISASKVMAQAVVNVLQTTPAGQTIILATGRTMLGFYPELIRIAEEQKVDLRSFNYGQLDNYVWRPSLYPRGPGSEDFIAYLQKNFLEPAHIPPDHFYPIDGVTEEPAQTAKRYDQWLSKQKIAAVFLSLGPLPEVHLAYMKANTPLDSGVHALTLSDSTIARNKTRGEKGPTEAITLGLANIRAAAHKFVLTIGKPEEVRLALTGPITPDVVATALRTDGFQESVHVYMDEVSAGGL